MTNYLELFLAKVNAVTAFHRHGNKIPKRRLDELSNAQLDMEEMMRDGWEFEQPTKCPQHVAGLMCRRKGSEVRICGDVSCDYPFGVIK